MKDQVNAHSIVAGEGPAAGLPGLRKRGRFCGGRTAQRLRPVTHFAMLTARVNSRPNKKQTGDLPMVGLCGLPPIEQKTLDGWGTVSSPVGFISRGFHLPWVSSLVGFISCGFHLLWVSSPVGWKLRCWTDTRHLAEWVLMCGTGVPHDSRSPTPRNEDRFLGTPVWRPALLLLAATELEVMVWNLQGLKDGRAGKRPGPARATAGGATGSCLQRS